MPKTFLIMDHTGHSTLEFTDDQRQEINEKFLALHGQGMTAATRAKGQTDYQVTRDPADLKDETLFVPRLKGG